MKIVKKPIVKGQFKDLTIVYSLSLRLYVKIQTYDKEKEQYKCIVLGSLSLPLGGLMRIIPVPRRTSDIHEPSPLIKNSVDNSKNSAGTMKIEFSFSFAMWILVCLLILCHASAEFFPLWIVHLRAHGGSFAMFASAGLNALVKVLKPLAKLIDL